jgi:hypothetical protein
MLEVAVVVSCPALQRTLAKRFATYREVEVELVHLPTGVWCAVIGLSPWPITLGAQAETIAISKVKMYIEVSVFSGTRRAPADRSKGGKRAFASVRSHQSPPGPVRASRTDRRSDRSRP